MEASHKASNVHRVDLSEVAPVMLPVPSAPPLSRRWFPAASASQWRTLVQMAAVLGAALSVTLFLFWQTVAAMGHTWVHDRSYSQGFIVPIIAIFLACTGRQNLVGKRPQPRVAGLFLLGRTRLCLGRRERRQCTGSPGVRPHRNHCRSGVDYRRNGGDA